MSGPSSAEVRAGLDHPIVDVDGHFVEVAPVLHDEIIATLEELGGVQLRDRYLAGPVRPTDTSSILEGRTLGGVRDVWAAMPSWWGWPVVDAEDRATAHLPALLYERLDEFGIDFSVLYPSMTLSFLEVDDAELSAALCRATNRHHARAFAPFADRMTPGALIPMHDPEVAVAELRHAVTELGFKAVVIAAYARRPIPKLEREHGRLSPAVYRLDHFGIDSEHDYDPFWRACVELGVAPAVHSSVQYHDLSRSVSNYVYNHVNGIAKCHEALAKSLLLGGVPHRFPQLRIGFLEGGVGWAAMLYTGLLGHWEKRNGRAITDLDPAKLDVDAVMARVASHGDERVRAHDGRVRDWFAARGAAPEQLDEFAPTGWNEPSDLREQFVRSFFMGCEADDPLVCWAFAEKVNPMGARLGAMFGSDISHWDVPDMAEPVAEAWEHVEHGVMDTRDFRDFMFANAVRMHGGADPAFFAGTAVDAAARAELESLATQPAAR
jgi:predicted TIM-barrel fold metal-dependent hydrolase